MKKVEAGGGTIVSHPTLSTGLANYYKFEGNATDEVGSDNGSVTGATQDSGGIQGDCYLFDGLNDKIDYSATVIDPTQAFSFQVWFKTTDNTANQMIIGNGDNTNGYYLYYDAGGPQLKNRFGPDDYLYSWTPTDNQWYHLVVTYDGAGDYNLYIDGTSIYNPTITSEYAPDDNLYVGYWSPSSILWMKGRLDEIGHWTKELTSDEVTDLYNGGAGIPYN
jgi:hypothetical protein